ncbi:MAG: DinB family protein [Candidatus Zixiibacteriota bacterium]
MAESEIVDVMERVFSATLKIAHAVPDESLEFWPAPDTMTVREHLDHMAYCLEELSAPVAAAVGMAPPEGSSDAPCERLSRSITRVLDIFRAVEAIGWDTPVVMPGDHTMSIRRVALTLIEHDAHHRGQLIVMLRLIGIDPPKRWSD